MRPLTCPAVLRSCRNKNSPLTVSHPSIWNQVLWELSVMTPRQARRERREADRKAKKLELKKTSWRKTSPPSPIRSSPKFNPLESRARKRVPPRSANPQQRHARSSSARAEPALHRNGFVSQASQIERNQLTMGCRKLGSFRKPKAKLPPTMASFRKPPVPASRKGRLNLTSG